MSHAPTPAVPAGAFQLALRVPPGRLGLSLFFPTEEGRLPFVAELSSTCPFALRVGDELRSVAGLRITKAEQFLSLRPDAKLEFVFARSGASREEGPTAPRVQAADGGPRSSGPRTKTRQVGGASLPSAMGAAAKRRRTAPRAAPCAASAARMCARDATAPVAERSARCRKTLCHRKQVLERVTQSRVAAEHRRSALLLGKGSKEKDAEEYLAMTTRLASETQPWNRTRGRVVDYRAIALDKQNDENNAEPCLATLQERVGEIKAFYGLHGRSPTQKDDVSGRLFNLCRKFVDARRHPERHKGLLTGAIQKELDSFHFVWNPKNTPKTPKRLHEHIQELRAHVETHGQWPKGSVHMSLFRLCKDLRASRRSPAQAKFHLSADQIASLDAFGFEWEEETAVVRWLERLRAYRAEHGHLNVPWNSNTETDNQLYRHCSKLRYSRKNPENRWSSLLDARYIQELDSLGFQW